MIQTILLSLGAILILSCGTVRILLTKSIINGFNSMSNENKKVTFMEWIVEGIVLYFIGIVILVITLSGKSEDFVSNILFGASFALLLIMTIISLMTVINLKIEELNLQPNIKKIISIHFKSCPIIKLSSGILFLLGTFL